MIESAGRSRLIQLRRDLATAREGRALLDRKREAILRAVNDRLPRLARLRETAADTLAAARRQLADAQVDLGRTAVDAAALAQQRAAPIDAAETSLVGVPVPQIAAPAAVFVPRYGPASGSTALDRAGAAYMRAMPELLALAAADAAIERLRHALARTVRRLNALDSIVLPELANEIHVVTSALEEEERDEAVRRDRWRARGASGMVR